MAALEKTGIPFIFMDGMGKVEPAKRKLIRKYVMLGRNRGKIRSFKSTKKTDSTCFQGADEVQNETSRLLITMCYSTIPNKVGSELSFTHLADTVEPPLLHDILKFSFIAKRVMYPLESCIVFHRETKVDTSWFELLTSDAVYLHAAIFSSQTYMLLRSGQECPIAATQAMEHYSATLRLLRERLAVPSGEDMVSDSTTLVVLYLVLHAHFTNDYHTAKHHMEGLFNIVDIRGGLGSFSHNTKLIMELLKCDLGIALNNGTRPLFFDDPYLEALKSYDMESLAVGEPDSSATKLHRALAQMDFNADLLQVWTGLKRFCSTINSIVDRKRQLPKETLLNTMASVMYRLLRMTELEPTSANEALRLGILVFSFHIFLNWQDIKLPNTHLTRTYRNCLVNIKLPSKLPPRILLWLLTIGSVSTFHQSDDAWLLPQVQVNIELCKIHDWNEMRTELKAFLWIDTLHDKPGRLVFDAAELSHADGKAAPQV